MQIPDEPQAIDNKLKKPGDIAVDGNGNIYVAETAAHRIAETDNPKIYMFAPCVYKFNPNGKLIHTYFVDEGRRAPKAGIARQFDCRRRRENGVWHSSRRGMTERFSSP